MCRWIVFGALVVSTTHAVCGQTSTAIWSPSDVTYQASPGMTDGWRSVPAVTQAPIYYTVAQRAVVPGTVAVPTAQSVCRCNHGSGVQSTVVSYPAAPAARQVVMVPVGGANPVAAPGALPPTTIPGTVYQPFVPSVAPSPVYYFGRGILGQPKIYVPGQPVRNALRFLTF